jgi:S-(hydroxymethyl)glutathione dehydrogenase/alcohol dehydrogenase
MKSTIINKVNSPLEIIDLTLSDLQYGQVLVKMKISGLCGAQLQEIAGDKNNEKFMPHLTGHEGAGMVEKVGPGVSKVKPGDKVILHWRKGSGIESDFPHYFMGEKKISGGKVNTLTEFAIVSENRVTSVPQDVDDDFCALMGCGISTSFSVVSKEADIKFGESVLVIGCGGVGLGCISAARMLNASPIIGIDKSQAKRELVEKNGGNLFNEDLAFSYLTENKIKLDCIIDTVGNLNLVSRFLHFLSDQGRCILVSLPKKDTSLSISDPNRLFGSEGQKIVTTQAGGFDPDTDIKRFVKLYQMGKIDYKSLITHRFGLEEINQAIETLRSGEAGRIMIDINNK